MFMDPQNATAPPTQTPPAPAPMPPPTDNGPMPPPPPTDNQPKPEGGNSKMMWIVLGVIVVLIIVIWFMFK